MDGTEDDLVYESEDEDETEVDSPEPDWNPYDDGLFDESDDMLEQLFEAESDDCEEFEGF